MKLKYTIAKNDDQKEITIKEYAELDKDMFTLQYEETYDLETLISAIETGKETLISTIRTKNLFPIGQYAEKISESIMLLNESESDLSYELLFDDKENIADEAEEVEKMDELKEDIENQADDLDDLLNDTSEFEDGTLPIKVSLDDLSEGEDEGK